MSKAKVASVEVEELPAPDPWDVTVAQSEFGELSAALAKLNPKINPLETSDEQRAIQERASKIQVRQQEIGQRVSAFLDGELSDKRVALDKKYIDEMAELPEVAVADLDHACLVIANINKERIMLHQELTRCSRIGGREKPPYPIHAGIIHPYEITDPAKIRLAFLGFGQGSGRGIGQKSSWPPNVQREGAS